jgi:hypothetical protein
VTIDLPKAALSGTKVSIVRAPNGDYRLCDREGYVVAHGDNPRALAEHAFANGAFEVCHEYNLREYEERRGY